MTDVSDTAWKAFLAKITAPLCYNFLKFIKASGTQFVQFLPSLLMYKGAELLQCLRQADEVNGLELTQLH
jgi:hypothetical protein